MFTCSVDMSWAGSGIGCSLEGRPLALKKSTSLEGRQVSSYPIIRWKDLKTLYKESKVGTYVVIKYEGAARCAES